MKRYRIAGCALALLTAFGCKASGSESKVAEGKVAESKPGSKASAKPEKKTAPEEGADPAPEKFTVRLNTTKGDILIDVTRKWAPKGADRFFELVKNGYFTEVAFFRVIEGFMAQAGIHGDPVVNTEWRTKRIKDDPVKESNTRGMVSFATGGPNTRTTQFFINFKDNKNLDRMGFAPFGKVRDMAVVDSLYNGYGEGAPGGRGPSQRRIQKEGNAFLKKEFPKLDYIVSASIE